MPELPDVEVFRQYFHRTSLHQRITKVVLRAPALLIGISWVRLRRELEGHQFISTRRHGKYFFAELETGKYLILHFGMTGDLKYFKDPPDEPLYTRFLIHFTNGSHLAFEDLRKFGKIGLTSDYLDFIRQLKLGPDILDESFDYRAFQKILSRKKGRIKALLMDQHMFAGIGNLWADEILFQAGINPAKSLDEISPAKKSKLFLTMKSVLVTAVESERQDERLPPHFLLNSREPNGTCPLCGRHLHTRKIAGRTTYYCSRHQK